MSRVIVGVDGSPGSIDALRWALEYADCREARLRIVSAWGYPAGAMLPVSPPPPAPEHLAEEALAVIDKALAEVGALDRHNIERTVVQGSPASVLLHEARHADLLVVGARGLGGFRGLLLGSVSEACIHHVPRPVVVVRSKETPA